MGLNTAFKIFIPGRKKSTNNLGAGTNLMSCTLLQPKVTIKKNVKNIK
uniref:Uncharacterized protein n=1 Tax=Anguilla anguilla TaxID=7936 RepID=A0A0E9T2F0_ANGAN